MSNVLFQDGDWRLVKNMLYRRRSIPPSSILHRCGDKFNVSNSWWHTSDLDTCVYCGTAVPDKIKGLHALHNWDR